MYIREATHNDCYHIASIAIATWVDTYAHMGMSSSYSKYIIERFTPEKITCLVENSLVLVAGTDFGLCGYAVVSETNSSSYEVETIYILPRFQSQGIGRRFIEEIVSRIKGNVWLKCADDNLKALDFYRRMEFVDTDVTWFELDGEKYRCLILERENN